MIDTERLPIPDVFTCDEMARRPLFKIDYGRVQDFKPPYALDAKTIAGRLRVLEQYTPELQELGGALKSFGFIAVELLNALRALVVQDPAWEAPVKTLFGSQVSWFRIASIVLILSFDALDFLLLALPDDDGSRPDLLRAFAAWADGHGVSTALAAVPQATVYTCDFPRRDGYEVRCIRREVPGSAPERAYRHAFNMVAEADRVRAAATPPWGARRCPYATPEPAQRAPSLPPRMASSSSEEAVAQPATAPTQPRAAAPGAAAAAARRRAPARPAARRARARAAAESSDDDDSEESDADDLEDEDDLEDLEQAIASVRRGAAEVRRAPPRAPTAAEPGCVQPLAPYDPVLEENTPATPQIELPTFFVQGRRSLALWAAAGVGQRHVRALAFSAGWDRFVVDRLRGGLREQARRTYSVVVTTCRVLAAGRLQQELHDALLREVRFLAQAAYYDVGVAAGMRDGEECEVIPHHVRKAVRLQRVLRDPAHHPGPAYQLAIEAGAPLPSEREIQRARDRAAAAPAPAPRRELATPEQRKGAVVNRLGVAVSGRKAKRVLEAQARAAQQRNPKGAEER